MGLDFCSGSQQGNPRSSGSFRKLPELLGSMRLVRLSVFIGLSGSAPDPFDFDAKGHKKLRCIVQLNRKTTQRVPPYRSGSRQAPLSVYEQSSNRRFDFRLGGVIAPGRQP